MTDGLAICRHKRIAVEYGKPFYRVPRVTAGSDRRAAVRVLANTFMRVVDNSSLENDAVTEIKWLCGQVRGLGYSGNMIIDSWKSLVSHARYVQFGRRWRCVQRELCDTLTW